MNQRKLHVWAYSVGTEKTCNQRMGRGDIAISKERLSSYKILVKDGEFELCEECWSDPEISLLLLANEDL